MPSLPSSPAKDTKQNAPVAERRAAPSGYPRRGSWLGPAWGRSMLRLSGWKLEGRLPERPRFVLIVAPHTSNWDSVFCLFAMFALDLRATWLGKHTMFWFPASIFLRWLGGEPINRDAGAGAVELAVGRFQTGLPWVFGVAPEGTRRYVADWKTGFYRVATNAQVAIVPVAVNYAERTVQILTAVTPSGEQESDLGHLRQLFHSGMARYPDRFADLPATKATVSP